MKKISEAGIALMITAIVSCVPAESSYEQGFIEVEPDVKVFYQKTGTGNKAVIVPAGFWLYDDFKHLAKDKTLIFFDMRGRGNSDFVKDTTLISIHKDVEDIEKIRQHFNLDKVSLVGWSYLGKAVMMYAKKYPSHIDRVVQIGPVPVKWNTSYPDSLKYLVPAQGTAALWNKFDSLESTGAHKNDPVMFSYVWWEASKPNLLGNPDNMKKLGRQWGDHLKYSNELYINFMYRQMKYHFGSVMEMTDTIEDYADVSCPVLTIHGTKDRNAPWGAGLEWASNLPDARLLKIEGAGHLPWIEEPDLVYRAMKDFLK
ncbi:MAG: alpha/beta hydrolase [Cyclobacteriaceae bacterium]|nr:alpha/beta hydrolase [Cyclobacteriaceae bacterium]